MKKTKKYGLIVISVIYAVSLVYLLFAKGNRVLLSGASLSEYISVLCNFVPFVTIVSYVKALTDHSVNIMIPIKNLGGNFILFMPFALIMYAFTKMKEMKFLAINFLLILAIEVMQIVTRTGSFDVDDIILNMLGAGLAYWGISRVLKCTRE